MSQPGESSAGAGRGTATGAGDSPGDGRIATPAGAATHGRKHDARSAGNGPRAGNFTSGRRVVVGASAERPKDPAHRYIARFAGLWVCGTGCCWSNVIDGARTRSASNFIQLAHRY